MAPKKVTGTKPKGASASEPKALFATINLHKRLHGVAFKNKAPRAIREIKAFAAALMRTKDVRVDSELNKAVWAKGVRNVPFRLRLRLERKRSEEEDGAGGMYTHVMYKKVESFKKLHSEAAELKDE